MKRFTIKWLYRIAYKLLYFTPLRDIIWYNAIQYKISGDRIGGIDITSRANKIKELV